METTFEKARKGDRVCVLGYRCVENGTNATIISVQPDSIVPLQIKLDIEPYHFFYRIDGTQGSENSQTLFWSKPYMVIPVRPKILVKKKVYLGYSPVAFDSGLDKHHITSNMYYCKDSDIAKAYKKIIEIEIEVEE